MKEKIVKISKGKEGIVLPGEYLRALELIPGAEVEVRVDKKKQWIIIRPLHGDDFEEYLEHFRDSMESMA